MAGACLLSGPPEIQLQEFKSLDTLDSVLSLARTNSYLHSVYKEHEQIIARSLSSNIYDCINGFAPVPVPGNGSSFTPLALAALVLKAEDLKLQTASMMEALRLEKQDNISISTPDEIIRDTGMAIVQLIDDIVKYGRGCRELPAGFYDIKQIPRMERVFLTIHSLLGRFACHWPDALRIEEGIITLSPGETDRFSCATLAIEAGCHLLEVLLMTIHFNVNSSGRVMVPSDAEVYKGSGRDPRICHLSYMFFSIFTADECARMSQLIFSMKESFHYRRGNSGRWYQEIEDLSKDIKGLEWLGRLFKIAVDIPLHHLRLLSSVLSRNPNYEGQTAATLRGSSFTSVMTHFVDIRPYMHPHYCRGHIMHLMLLFMDSGRFHRLKEDQGLQWEPDYDDKERPGVLFYPTSGDEVGLPRIAVSAFYSTPIIFEGNDSRFALYSDLDRLAEDMTWLMNYDVPWLLRPFQILPTILPDFPKIANHPILLPDS